MEFIKQFHLFNASPGVLKRTLRSIKWTLAISFIGLNYAQAEFSSIVEVGLAGDSYFTLESANNGQAFANLLIQNTWSESQLWIDVGAGGLVGDRAHSYIKAPHLFYRMGKSDHVHFIVGRYRNRWSLLDRQWELGQTQPLFNWNMARPEQQGLTGLFVNIPVIKKQWSFTLFASYFYLPTQGASYELSDGELTSSNPWFSPPVEAISYSDEVIDLNYDIRVPNVQDIVFQPSWGLQFANHPLKRGFLFNAFYLNKPRNELVLPFEGALNLSTFEGDIDIRPQVARHQVYGFDFGWDYSWGLTTFSWMREATIDYDVPESTTYPVLPDQDMYGVSTQVRVFQTQKLKLSYLYTDREKTRVQGLFSSADIEAYLLRNRFDHAIRFDWENILASILSQYQLRASLGVTHNLNYDNSWVSFDISWVAMRGLSVFSNCDLFGGSQNYIIGEDFISQYQNNDRCLVGGRYAF